jgi:regulatory protein
LADDRRAMRKIVGELRPGDARGKAIVIFDDGVQVEIDREIVKKTGICVGREIDSDSLDLSIREHNYEKCYDAALHFLEYRARSEEELRRHLLLKRKFDSESVTRSINKLKEVNLIDDKAFAESWTKDRISCRPKSRLMIKRELLQKGVDRETAAGVTDDIDDGESAFNAGIKKARLVRNLEYPEFYKRVAAYLGRRGYSGDVVYGAVTRLWKYICEGLSEK